MLSARTFRAMGVDNTVAVADARHLEAAFALARAEIEEIDRVCSRFRPESELCAVNAAAGRGPRPVTRLLADALAAALDAASMTGGLVDPTVGGRVAEIGYTVTFGALAEDGLPLALAIGEVPGWGAVELDEAGCTVTLPAGVVLDLGASGKAWAADRAATRAAASLGAGVLVECGGDVAVSGPAPAGGWPVRVGPSAGAASGQDVTVRDGGLATSGTSRRWRRGGVEVHDIIDPATGLPAATPWRMASVAAASCLEANAAATAALVMGERAPRWLEERHLPARLVAEDGAVVLTAGWGAWWAA